MLPFGIQIDLAGIAPFLISFLTGVFILVIDAFSAKGQKGKLAYVGLTGVGLSILACFAQWDSSRQIFNNMVYTDNFALFFNLIFFTSAALAILLSVDYIKLQGLDHGEYYSLILFATSGMVLMAQAASLIMIFLGLEILSISVYILAGFNKANAKSNEAAIKYLLLGAFASGFLLYGLAFVYGSVGSLDLVTIHNFLESSPLGPSLLVGIAFLIVGFSFKIAMFPFHMWTPDVYEGAPTSVTAFMSVGPKAAGFAAFLRVFLLAFPSLRDEWGIILWVLAAVTMTLGNIMALTQNNIKRMLAYSSIAHAGYIMVAMVAGSGLGTSSIMFYILAYAFMNMGAFGVVIMLGSRGQLGEDIDDYRSIGYLRPLLGLSMTIFMFSLAGIPPTAGFVAKFFIFSAAVKAGFIWLTIIGVLNSVLSLYYYLRVIVYMYMYEPEDKAEKASLIYSPALIVALIISVIATLQIGIFPSFFYNLAKESILSFL